jgi:hypothetical protein
MKSILKFGFIALLMVTFFFPAMAFADKNHGKEEGSGSSAQEHGKATSESAKDDHEKNKEGSDNKNDNGDDAHEDSGKHEGKKKNKADHKKKGS